MGMIRRADLEGCARNALVMDLGDLGARGEALVAEANRRAEQIVREARAERERLIATARDEGYRAGFAEGQAKGASEGEAKGVEQARAAQAETLETVTRGWAEALEAFESRREAMLQAARTEVVRLAAEIASRVTRRVVELDAEAVLPQIEAVLGVIARPSRLTLRVHPDDLAVAQAELPDIVARFDQCRHAELCADATLERGSCVAQTEEGGRIDADIASQLDRVLSALLPGDETIRMERTARGDAA
jgi:flagellar assembly protein FliH